VIALALLKRFWLPALIVLVVSYALFAAYGKGYNKADTEWQQKWDKAVSEVREEQGRITAERIAEYEQNLKVTQNDLDKANADLAASKRKSDSVQRAAETRVASIKQSLGACTAAASQAAAESARVLADVLKLADNAAGKLAEHADQAITRGQSCERQYDSLR